MSEIVIPPAALEAGARALADAYYRNCTDGRLTMADTDDAPEDWYVEARAAFVAMVKAWPGMREGHERVTHRDFGVRYNEAIILPLTQENSDDQ